MVLEFFYGGPVGRQGLRYIYPPYDRLSVIFYSYLSCSSSSSTQRTTMPTAASTMYEKGTAKAELTCMALFGRVACTGYRACLFLKGWWSLRQLFVSCITSPNPLPRWSKKNWIIVWKVFGFWRVFFKGVVPYDEKRLCSKSNIIRWNIFTHSAILEEKNDTENVFELKC